MKLNLTHIALTVCACAVVIGAALLATIAAGVGTHFGIVAAYETTVITGVVGVALLWAGVACAKIRRRTE